MIIVRTPLRISLFGGGTDFKQWYNKHGGLVLSFTIDKYTYVTCKEIPEFIPYNNRIIYSEQEHTNTVEEIKNSLVREVMKFFRVSNLEIMYTSDLPAGGLGTSSSFTIGLIKALSTNLKNNYDIAKIATIIECDILKSPMGYQDQYGIAFDGFKSIKFSENSISVRGIRYYNLIKKIENKLALFYIGKRTQENIEKDKIDNINKKEKNYKKILSIAEEAYNKIMNGSIDNFGELLHQSWIEKKKLSNKVSNNYVDEIYDIARIDGGAEGGKLLGAGDAGYILFWCNDRKKLISSLKDLHHIPFKFTNKGNKFLK